MRNTHSCAIPGKAVLILGAGFSHVAGLPLQRDLTGQLVDDDTGDKLEQLITYHLKCFLQNVFGWREGTPLPDLEDFFTCIDLSANTGHYLGAYTPAMLRAIRRMAIHRFFKLLNRVHYPCDDEIYRLLNHFDGNSNFIVLNWDIVLENYLMFMNHSQQIEIDYCCTCKLWKNIQENGRMNDGHLRRDCNNKIVRVAKLHGSANWVYCDSCKQLYYSLDSKLSLRLNADLEETDFKVLAKLHNGRKPADIRKIKVKELLHFDEQKLCPKCQVKLSSHIATMSFEKSFRTRIFSSIWYEAEKLLAEAERWVFIGYSLPAADYKFKHLLKSAQLRNKTFFQGKRNIDVVVNCDSAAIQRYEKFFGRELINPYIHGLKDYVNRM